MTILNTALLTPRNILYIGLMSLVFSLLATYIFKVAVKGEKVPASE